MSSFNRRELIAAGLLLPAMPSLLHIPPALAAPAPGGIDVHCHLFNASDLPIRGFLRRVVFEDYEDQENAFALPSPLAALIATLVGFLRNGVVTADEELRQLTESAMSLSEPFDPFSPEAQRALEESLRAVLSGNAASLAPDEPPVPRESVEAFRDAIRDELAVGPQSLVGPAADSAAPTASRLFAAPGAIGNTMRWAAWLRSPRLRLVERIKELYGGDGKVTFFVPALVDYDNWLDDSPRSGMASQVAVMEAVQKAAFERLNVFVHSLATFDPWREAVDEAEGRSPSAFDLAREAVEQRGFIGVKLYPPMGFLPGGNAGAGLTYPEGSGTGFAEKLDAALDRLFSWAESESVPILAHAADSNGAGEGYSHRADPAGWQVVLERHPNLHLNLAHFGGFDHLSGGEPWETATGNLITRYPNVHADLSYLAESLPWASPQKQARIAGQIRAFLTRFPEASGRLVYGSDWIMLGKEADHQRYFDSVRALLGRAGVTPAQWAEMTRGNAIRLYGLGAGAPGRARLEDWYRRQGLDPAVLSQFG